MSQVNNNPSQTDHSQQFAMLQPCGDLLKMPECVATFGKLIDSKCEHSEFCPLCNKNVTYYTELDTIGGALVYLMQTVRAVAEAILQADPNSVEKLGSTFQNDADLMYIAYTKDITLLRFAGPDAAWKLIEKQFDLFQYLSRDVALVLLSQNGTLLKYGSEEHKADDELVETASNQNGKSILYATEAAAKKLMIKRPELFQHGRSEWRDNPLFVKEILEKDGKQFSYTGEVCRQSIELMRIATTTAPEMVSCGPPEVILIILKEKGLLLEHVSIAQKNDITFVNAAMESAKESLRFADQSIIKTKVLEDNSLFQFIPEELQKNAVFVDELLQEQQYLIGAYLPDELLKDNGRLKLILDNLDKSSTLEFIKRHLSLLPQVRGEWKGDVEFLTPLLTMDGLLFKWALGCSDSVELLTIATAQNPLAIADGGDTAVEFLLDKRPEWLEFCNNSQKNTLRLVSIAVQKNPKVIYWAGSSVILQLVEENPANLIPYVDQTFKENLTFAIQIVECYPDAKSDPTIRKTLQAVLIPKDYTQLQTLTEPEICDWLSRDGKLLKYLTLAQQDTPLYVKTAVKNCQEAFGFAGPTCKNSLEIIFLAIRTAPASSDSPHLITYLNKELVENIFFLFLLLETEIAANHRNYSTDPFLKAVKSFSRRQHLDLKECIEKASPDEQLASACRKTARKFLKDFEFSGKIDELLKMKPLNFVSQELRSRVIAWTDAWRLTAYKL